MIRLANVSFAYGTSDVQALREIDLEIKEGEVVLLSGPSGCGKSTLIRLMNGIVPHHHHGTLTGECEINGHRLEDVTVQELSATVSTVFQNPKSQFFNLNTTEELLFGCSNHGVPREEMLERLEVMKEELGIGHLVDRSIFGLSGGEKQRIALAGAALMQPRLLLLDEPSSNLDAKTIEVVVSMLRAMKERGTTIVVAEHRLYYLLGLCDRIVYINSGRIERELSPQELLSVGNDERVRLGLRSIRRPELPEPVDPPVADAAVRVAGLQVSYRDRIAVDIADLKIPRQTVVAITGPNGSGKTTLAMTLAGVNRASGEIGAAGASLRRRALMRRTYVVMQDVNYQLITESVLEELESARREDDSTEAMELLRHLGLAEVCEQHPLALSGGQKQRVSVATAIYLKKRFLIFDEPTSGLDHGRMLQFAQLIERIRGDMELLAIITHDVELIHACCDYVIEMGEGRVVRQYGIKR